MALISMALAVALGAFGAHGLSESVSPARLETWDTAVRYHLWMSVTLLIVSLWTGGVARVAIGCLWIGTAVFSGSLYALVLLDWPILGAVTPMGGLLMITGLVWAAWTLHLDQH